MATTTASSWRPLGTVAISKLLAARLELHWAAQIACGIADAWIERRLDDSHTSLTWRPELDALVGEPAPGGLAIALGVADLSVLAVRGDRIESRWELRGKTLADGLAWADARIAEAAGGPPRKAHARDYDMPAHPVGSGKARFAAEPGPLAELAAWYGDAVLAIADAIRSEPTTAPLRVWPHHFDLGSIIYLDPPSEHARQIGIGLSPGDGSYAEPYFYLTPYPLVPEPQFPKLDGGHWHREGFTGAILTATELLAAGATAEAQQTATQRFLASAISGGRSVIPTSAAR